MALRSALLAALFTLAACSSQPTSGEAGDDEGGTGGTAAGGGKGGNAGSPAGGKGGSAGRAGGGAAGSASGGADGGSGGAPGSGGVLTPDAAVGGDGGSGGQPLPDAAADTSAPADGPPALMECPKPSIDRITQWNATAEGTTVPMNGTLLVKEGDHYVAKEKFVGNEWHVLEILIANAFEAQVDLSASMGFTLTYNTTADLWVQLRPASHWDGGDKWVTKIPSTAGAIKQAFFPFTPASWTTLAELGKPSYTFASALKEARGLLFVGKTPNTIALYGLRIDGYVPMCR